MISCFKKSIPSNAGSVEGFCATISATFTATSFGFSLDMYFSFKWVDVRLRVALVQIIYHARDINIMSLKIEKDPRSGKESVIGIRPEDQKRCIFEFNSAHPALSGWTI